MPIIRLPKVKLGFLKKLRRDRPETVQGTEPAEDRPASPTAEPATTNEPVIVTPATESPAHAVERSIPLIEGPAMGRPDKKQDEKTDLQEPPLEECPICHDLVGATNPEGILESWVHLHCGHKFGSNCIQCWIEESAEIHPHYEPTCPICRTTAKHPCGHPIVVPLPRASPLWSLQMPVYQEPHRRPPRRRLTRRSGHPLRPPPPAPQPDPHRVQTVGKCAICAAIAAAEEMRRKRSTAARVGTSGTTDSEQSQGGDGRSTVKSVLLQTSFRRLSISSPESPRGETHGTFVEIPIEPNIAHHTNLCRTEANIPRSPTPAPVSDRHFSF